MSVRAQLEHLADAFEAHGVAVRSNLLPGASDAELLGVEAALGVDLPSQLREIYRWSAGCSDDFGRPCLKFRDMPLLRVDRVVECHRQVTATYAGDAGEPAAEFYGVDLARSVPFAEFMGSTLLVSCGDQRLLEAARNPVICAFQGIDAYFVSIDSMLATCIEWVAQPAYRAGDTAPNEMEIWLRNNPGVFA